MTSTLPNDRLLAPAWLDALCPPPNAPTSSRSDACTLHRADHEGLLRLTGVIPRAQAMDTRAFERAIGGLYTRLFAETVASDHPHLLRVWNGLPGITEPMTPTPDTTRDWESRAPRRDPFNRYMVFNAARNAAFLERFGHDTELARVTPAATAVGHRGADVQVHLLASRDPATAIENPRQTPAYRYSPRFGPKPPVFVRATRYRGRLFVSGTASVVGEDSMHPDDLDAQLTETLHNLRIITQHDQAPGTPYQHLRVYAARPDTLARLTDDLQQAYPDMATLELMHADICRPSLLVEIEAAT